MVPKNLDLKAFLLILISTNPKTNWASKNTILEGIQATKKRKCKIKERFDSSKN